MDPRITRLVELIAEHPENVPHACRKWKDGLGADVDLKGLVIEGLDLNNADFAELDLSSAKFIGTQLAGAKFAKTTLTGAQFVDVEAPRIAFTEAILNDATFTDGNLSTAEFHRAELKGAKFLGPDLSGAVFNSADISSADLSPCKVDSNTQFDAMKSVEGCRIDRYTLESLDEYGGLTKGDRMQMIIRDDVAKLRSAYSGFKERLHWFALTVFVFPYVWFLVKSWAVARFQEDGLSGIAIWEAILRYIVTGGEGWRDGWSVNLYSFVPFVLALIYNVLRLVLLVKTKRLELQESISGLPAMFSLQGRWNFWYQTARIGFWLNLLVVAVHSYHFLRMTVPIG